ncbi:MAG TPA: bifunctional phosphopantothenoylcysteine decarboxylase/phosphopantothenate--cysteine ligase CoaBC [Deltaproteobacteria bacterium]|nr:bifunctional phosphopantothenoylcysteine decarboxylase/phosphopantothenate--cysteine ligase CoaBC [Deltaproteobacteria bacterium]
MGSDRFASLKGRAGRVLLAVSGGIAAYKAPELVRALVKGGHNVRCTLTPAAERFVSPLVLSTLCGARVRSALFDSTEEGEIDHIALADWAELVIVAPATAHLLARMAHGLADDLTTTLLLATRAPVLAVPAMNVNMWRHPATQQNLVLLRERGVRFLGPEAGELACGWEGEGRMSEPSAIAAMAGLLLTPPTLAGEVLLVTAGGTREAIDPVRAITNRSSGKMGFAIASEAARRGAQVVLVAGPTSLATPLGVRRVDVESALEMQLAVQRELVSATVVIMTAAVSDFRVAKPADRKIRKEDLPPGAGLSLELVRNPDILKQIGEEKGRRIVVGFAAESHDLVENARKKLVAKKCDIIVANDITREGSGFDVDANAVVFVWPGGGVEELPLLSKLEVAGRLLDHVEKLRDARQGGAPGTKADG